MSILLGLGIWFLSGLSVALWLCPILRANRLRHPAIRIKGRG